MMTTDAWPGAPLLELCLTHEGIEMSESTTSISVIALSALGALAFFASFDGQFMSVAQLASALLFPGLIFLLLVGAIGIIRILLALSES